MNVESLSAIVFFSPDPERLAAFYRENLGIALAPESHGPMKKHHEATLAGVHVAVLKGAGPASDRGSVGLAPTFRVRSLDDFVEALERAGAPLLRKILELGEQKRLATFRDPDGNVFNLIDLGFDLRAVSEAGRRGRLSGFVACLPRS